MKYYALMICIVACGLLAQASAQSCSSCYRNHTQQIYCNSEVVSKVTALHTERSVTLDIPGYTTSTYKKVTATVNADFKPGNLMSTGADITFYTPSSFCGATFTSEQIYVITGKMIADPSSATGRTLMMGSCDKGLKWDELSEKQQKGFESKYGRFCQCELIGVKTASSVLVATQEGGAGYAGAVSYWTPYRNCFYNAQKSQAIQVDDCEEKYGYCKPTRGGNKGECNWELTPDYETCFESREAIADRGGAAMTDPSQCDVLLTKKRRCRKRAKANQLRSQGRTLPAYSEPTQSG